MTLLSTAATVAAVNASTAFAFPSGNAGVLEEVFPGFQKKCTMRGLRGALCKWR